MFQSARFNLMVLTAGICAGFLGAASYDAIELILDRYQPRPEPPITRSIACAEDELGDFPSLDGYA